MGTWGAKLYQDDLAEDIKESYKKLLQEENTNEEAINKMLKMYKEEIEDEEEGPVFWLVFADVLWKYGRLTEEIKEKAIKEIETGENLKKWKEEGTPKEYKIREEEIEKLKNKLNTQMPKEKRVVKIRRERPQEDKWQIGDTYAYKITEKETKDADLLGRYLILRKVDEYESNTIYEADILYIQVTDNEELPKTKEELEKLEYIIASNEGNVKHEYRMKIDSISKKKRNEILIYIGNFMSVDTPEDEYIEKEKISIPSYSFKNIDYIVGKIKHSGTNKHPVYYEVNPENISDSYVRFLMRVDYYEKALNMIAPKEASSKENPLLYIALVDSMMIGGLVKNPIGSVDEEIKKETYEKIKELKKIINETKDEEKIRKIQILDEFEEKVRNYKIPNWSGYLDIK